MSASPDPPRVWAIIGCLGMALTMFLLCLMPLFLFDAMQLALQKLHLNAQLATVLVFGILLGGLINIPIYRIERHGDQPIDTGAIFGVLGLTPRLRRVRRDTIIAVNVGGCVIPVALAVWQILYIFDAGGRPLQALLLATAVNVLACYSVARPIEGIGIAMPGLASPLVAVGAAWLLLMPADYDDIRAPVAFVAGVMGPLIGADLFHLRDITKVSVGMLSIGGAGTFDGIVLSGLLAALLA